MDPEVKEVMLAAAVAAGIFLFAVVAALLDWCLC